MARIAQNCKQCGRIIYFDGLCIDCRTENERRRILAFTQEEIDVSIEQICSEIESMGKLSKQRDLFVKLLDYRDIDTSKIARAAFKKELFYPRELYKDAPDDIVKEMLAMLRQDDLASMRANHLLLCLAVCGGDEVFRAFLELEKHPRKWREKLHVNPSFYAAYGGWSYDEGGKFLRTIYDKCYPMVKGTPEEKKSSPVKIGVRAGENCPRCGCGLVNLLEIDGRDERLNFLGINGVIKARCCPNCVTCSEENYCRYQENGESELFFGENSFTAKNYFTDEGLEELASNTYILGDTPVPLRYAADWEGGSAVGGVAFWIQDCEMKRCPDCGRPMKYLAQVQWDTVFDSAEGNAYIEICEDCKVMAVLHQQT